MQKCIMCEYVLLCCYVLLVVATSSSCAKEVQKVVVKGQFESLHSLADSFVVTIGRIVASLITEGNLAPLIAAALCKEGIRIR